MTDIVARLRNLGWETCHEAAAEIERLDEELRQADRNLLEAIEQRDRALAEVEREDGKTMLSWHMKLTEQAAEIERLTEVIKQNNYAQDITLRQAGAENGQLRAEIEQLKAEIKWLYDQIAAQKRTAGAAAVAALEPKP